MGSYRDWLFFVPAVLAVVFMIWVFFKFRNSWPVPRNRNTTRNRFALPACRHRRSAGRAAASLHAEILDAPLRNARIGLNDRRKSLHPMSISMITA